MKKFKLNSLKYLFLLLTFLTITLSFYNSTSYVSCKSKNVKSPYADITLTPVRCINSRTYKITFDSNKIILKKDVNKSYISLKNKRSTLKATFSSVSVDGKKITYILNKKSIKKITPGNGSMNGSYDVNFSFCKYKTAVMYTEKIIKRSITGFILSSDGVPIYNASVSLKTKNNKLISSRTDKNGQYTLAVNKVTSGHLTVQKTGYIKQILNNIKTSENSALCQNFILKSRKSSPIAAMFRITDLSGNSLSNCQIDIIDCDKNIANFTTDKNGRIIIKNTKSISAFSSFTNINISDKIKEISYINKKYNTSNIPVKTCSIKKENSYIFSISQSTNNSASSYKRLQFRFSFNDIHTDNVCFNIKLSKSVSDSSISDMSINLDSNDLVQNTTNFTIELFPLITSDLFSEPIFRYNCYIPAELHGNSSFKLRQLISSSDNNSQTLPDDSLSLSDGLYYIKLKAFSSGNISIGGVCITPFKVIDGKFDTITASIKPKCSKEIIAYVNSDINRHSSDFTSDISFILCQNKDDQIIPVAPIYIDNCYFTYKKDTSFAIASLTLTDLSLDCDYTIYPYYSYSEFTIASKKNFYTSANNSIDQVECLPSDSINNSKTFSELYQHNLELSTKLYSIITLSSTLIRSAPDYPNSVLCIYDTESEISSVSCINTSAASYISSANISFDIFTNNDYIHV